VSLTELLASDGVEEICELRSRFGFMAFHGGSLEQVTDVIASRAAAAAGASYYGIVQTGPPRHLASTQLDPAESSALRRFLDHVEVVITVHGYGRWGLWTTLLLGGGNRRLAHLVRDCLGDRLPDYTLAVELDDIPKELRGLHPRNPVNLPVHGGVQLELPPRVRGRTPHYADWPAGELVPPTVALIDGLVEAATRWPLREPDAR
jgi:phage replication-related protein YjqB (UPF0714/DUF867 family)